MTDAPRKPFWKRKRWIAAAVLWLVVMYFVSAGPVEYAIRRGWLPMVLRESVYRPAWIAAGKGVPHVYSRYLVWWWRHGIDDRE